MTRENTEETEVTPAAVTEFCWSNNIGVTDLRFTDLPGTLQHRYEMSAADLGMTRQVPGSPDGVLAALEGGNEFLMRDGVFTDDVIETWLEYKANDVDDLRLMPHPIEFFKHFDA